MIQFTNNSRVVGHGQKRLQLSSPSHTHSQALKLDRPARVLEGDSTTVMPPDPGSTYRSIEAYLKDLEVRQQLEKAPCAAVFMLGSEEMLSIRYGNHPWIVRVRCELPTRPLGPGGMEEPVRATYIGANSNEDTQRFAAFVEAMRTIDVFSCVHLKLAKPSARALAHLEESDIVCLGDGPHVLQTWRMLSLNEECVLERVKWRYYSGAVLIGLGTGCQFLGQRWWVGEPRHELESREAAKAGQPDPHVHQPTEARYWGEKATEIVPCIVAINDAQAEALVELTGAGALCIVLPPKGSLIFNVDGCLEPCGALLCEYRYDWKAQEVRMALLSPPDEKTNLIACLSFLERRTARRQARRREAVGLVEDAPLPEDAAGGDPQEEGEEEEGGEEGEEGEAEGEEAKEEARQAERKAREEKHQWRAQLDKRKRAEAEVERLKGVTAFKAADWGGALDAFLRASELAPDDHRAHLNRSACLLKLGCEREAVLAADTALHQCAGADAKAWYRRASAWLATGEFNECLADLEMARRMEPAEKAIGVLKAKAEEERETATFSFSVDLKLAQNEDAQAAGEPVPHPNQLRMGVKPRGDLRAVRTMNAIEAFDGAKLTLRDDTLTMALAPSRALSDGPARVLAPAYLDHRALFSLEACAKRSSLETLEMHGVVLGAWGAAFLARGARLQGGAHHGAQATRPGRVPTLTTALSIAPQVRVRGSSASLWSSAGCAMRARGQLAPCSRWAVGSWSSI